jgi:hypothetical protein
MADHIFLVMELPYDKDERPIMHGAFEDCYAAMTVFGIIADQLRTRAGGKRYLAFYTAGEDIAHVEVDGGEYDRHTVVVERVAFTRRPEP